jgi:endoplasmic reticulum-Golgi intermediate compartment protein 2
MKVYIDAIHHCCSFNSSLTLIFPAFNFSHIISELSFGAFYPSLVNPLDRTVSATPNHFHRFQYFMSVVPTVYTVSRPPSPITPFSSSFTLFTNQYAVTEQSYQIGERNVPGIFFKYDIEPILLTVEESRESFLRFCVKIVNILSGVLVAAHWGFTISEWVVEVFGRRSRRKSEGVLNGKAYHDRDD